MGFPRVEIVSENTRKTKVIPKTPEKSLKKSIAAPIIHKNTSGGR